MSVIVDHRYPVPLPRLGEAPLHSPEVAQRDPKRIVAEPQRLGDRDRGKRILDVMPTEHWQKQLRNRARPIEERIGDHRIEPSGDAIELDIDGADIRLWTEPISQYSTVGQPGDHPLHDGMINAQRSKAVERDVADKSFEDLPQRVEISIKVEVFRID